MGERGTTPKLNSGRLRQNFDGANEEIVMHGGVKMPPVDRGWSELTKDWYKSLAASGQSQVFEPSDWQTARLVAGELDIYLKTTPRKRNPSAFTAIIRGMESLGSTHHSRLRARIEIHRTDEGKQESSRPQRQVDRFT